MEAATLFQTFFAEDSAEGIVYAFRKLVGKCCGPAGTDSVPAALKRNVRVSSLQTLLTGLEQRKGLQFYDKKNEILIVGCGPCGLRTAIEASLVGLEVTLIDKRTAFTRNNVVHLWPFVIEDLKAVGIKTFFPKFCIGSLNHISIRRLQIALLKIALILGVKVHLGLEFVEIVPPARDKGFYSVKTRPNVLAHSAFFAIVGAQGTTGTLPGFTNTKFRGKLALAITANFVNGNTRNEAAVEEISGVAFVYRQDFFNYLAQKLGVALENIVYYKDETHYFVMTVQKHSLLTKRVLKDDYSSPEDLLREDNLDRPRLYKFIEETCMFCTDYQLQPLTFVLNASGQPDVALFDFTTMRAAQSAISVMERDNRQLLLLLVGDSLLEPFWPTGTGIAKGFLSCFDAVWALRQWADGGVAVSDIIDTRETLYKLLPHITPEKVSKSFADYSINPKTRYGIVQASRVDDYSKYYSGENLRNVFSAPKENAAAAACGSELDLLLAKLEQMPEFKKLDSAEKKKFLASMFSRQ